jgi:hypothetical protein
MDPHQGPALGHRHACITITSSHLQCRHQEVFSHLAHHPKQNTHPSQEEQCNKHTPVAGAAVEQWQVRNVMHILGAVLVQLHKCASAPRGGTTFSSMGARLQVAGEIRPHVSETFEK